MTPLSRRSTLAIAAVVDVALHARQGPVSARDLADRLALPARHLETLLQMLVHAGILRGLRGPRGGYTPGRDRRHVTAADIVRAVAVDLDDDPPPSPPLIARVAAPAVEAALTAFLAELGRVTLDELCRRAEQAGLGSSGDGADANYTI